MVFCYLPVICARETVSFAGNAHGMNAFYLGIMIGLTLTISVGLNAGILFTLGMVLSDLALVILCYFGFAELILKWDLKTMGILAGLILIIMGVLPFLKKTSKSWDSNNHVVQKSKMAVYLGKGFLLNIVNPFSLIFWIGLVGFTAKKWGLHNQNVLLFFTGVFTTAISTDLIKCYLSRILSRVLTAVTISWINKAMGLAFIGIGFFIIYKVQ
jgi:threonine/homoserine/homoserine lactone efflux protein